MADPQKTNTPANLEPSVVVDMDLLSAPDAKQLAKEAELIQSFAPFSNATPQPADVSKESKRSEILEDSSLDSEDSSLEASPSSNDDLLDDSLSDSDISIDDTQSEPLSHKHSKKSHTILKIAILFMILAAAFVAYVVSNQGSEAFLANPGQAISLTLGTEKPKPVEPETIAEEPMHGEILVSDVSMQPIPSAKPQRRGAPQNVLVRGRLTNHTNRRQKGIALESSLLASDGLTQSIRTSPCCDDFDLTKAAELLKDPNDPHFSDSLNRAADYKLAPGESCAFSVILRDVPAVDTLRPAVRVKFAEAERLDELK